MDVPQVSFSAATIPQARTRRMIRLQDNRHGSADRSDLARMILSSVATLSN
jgi:hypothetical protein